MSFVLIIHEVDSYHHWKAIFDKTALLRKQAGEISYQLLKSTHNANHVVHFSQWISEAAARQFFESEELKQIRKNAGVKDPQFLYLDEIENKIL